LDRLIQSGIVSENEAYDFVIDDYERKLYPATMSSKQDVSDRVKGHMESFFRSQNWIEPVERAPSVISKADSFATSGSDVSLRRYLANPKKPASSIGSETLVSFKSTPWKWLKGRVNK